MSVSSGLDPALFAGSGMRAVLAARDISQVYRLLNEAGVPQRTIAGLASQSQSEVSEILKGRRVMAYDVLVRICTGLGIPRGLMGLAYDEGIEPVVESEPVGEEVDEEMKRRALLAVGGLVLCDRPMLAELLHIPTCPDVPIPLPGQLGGADVTALRALTGQLEAVVRAHGGGAEVLTPVALRAERLLAVPGSEDIKRDVMSAVAELHVVAGWAAFDDHQDDNARYHFARAMSLGGDADDGFVFSKAAYLAGVAIAERGHFNDGLKMLQLAQIRLGTAPRDPRTQELICWVGADSAGALSRMDRPDAARAALAAARDGWAAPDADDAADMDWVTGLVELNLDRADVAERLVATSVAHWEGTADRRQAVLGTITLATINVAAGEPRGREMAHRAISSVAELRSVRARERLSNLADALETRRQRADFAELARRARQVAASQA